MHAFRTATGLPPGEAVPATFPMRWLAAPEIRDALRALAAAPNVVPVHESQTFDYAAPLSIGEGYEIRLDARRETMPDRLILTGTIAASDGSIRVRLETILRLFSTAAVAA